MTFKAIFDLPRKFNQAILIFFDSIIFITSLWLAFSIRLDRIYLPSDEISILFFLSPITGVSLFLFLGIYRISTRYIVTESFTVIFKGIMYYGLLWPILVFLVQPEYFVPRSIFIINPIIAGAFLLSIRFFLFTIFSNYLNSAQINLIIFGAGRAGREIAKALKNSADFKAVAFVDDNPNLLKTEINGLRVHSREDIVKLKSKFHNLEIILSVDSLSLKDRSILLNELRVHMLPIKTYPSFSQFLNSDFTFKRNRINLKDLLGRRTINPDKNLLKKNIQDKNVLVTGAGGSIGSELSRQIINNNARRLVLLEINEFNLYSIENELKDLSLECEIIPILGSILDYELMVRICKEYSIDTFFHAAAYKHVPMVEKNIIYGTKNNVIGTLETVKAVINSEVSNYVFISSDKAVRPTNVMGASKRYSELIVQVYSNINTKIDFAIVRFGNVLGSSGSVVPLFQKQIAAGGPVTVTDKRITRFFMSISEAVSLVIQSSAIGGGRGKVFLLDMGEPIKIDDIARKMIKLSGHGIYSETYSNDDIEIIYTGLRPGEKLYEELLIGSNSEKTTHPQIYQSIEDSISNEELSESLKKIMIGIESNNAIKIIHEFEKHVFGYKKMH